MSDSSTPLGATAGLSSANADVPGIGVCADFFVPSDKKRRIDPSTDAVWEYEEKTIHGHLGWVPMSPDFPDQLEALYAIQPGAVIRIQKSEDPSVVWKIDIGKKTQRRLVDGKDNCKRRIRRIFLSTDTVGSSEAPAA